MFSKFSVRKKYTVVVAVVIVIILGVIALPNITTDLFPNVNLPYAIVSTMYPGKAPEEVELRVTRPIEQVMATVSNVELVRSSSQQSSSQVILQFVDGTDMDLAVLAMREALDLIKDSLPDDSTSPMILKLNPDMLPIMEVSVALKNKKLEESSPYIESVVVPALQSVSGVASVSANGLIENHIRVTLDEDKMAKVQEDITAAIMANATPSDTSTASTSTVPNRLQTTPGLLGNTQSAASAMGAANPLASLLAGSLGNNLTSGMGANLAQGSGNSAATGGFTISKDMISALIKGQNFDMPLGYVEEDNEPYMVRIGERFKTLSDITDMVIVDLGMEGVDPIKLSDVANIEVGTNSDKIYTNINGERAAILTIQKQSTFSTTDVTKNVFAKIKQLEEQNANLTFVPLLDQGRYINEVVNTLGLNLIIGAALALIILFMFLRDVKFTFIIGVSIPISLVITFVAMYFSGITLNIISMGGLALGVGMLVDNSIVVIENIYRYRYEGMPIKEAAIKGAVQVTGAITASTLTTVAVFTPILFTQGLTRDIFQDMGLTIFYSLLASLIVAISFVPMLSSVTNDHEKDKRHRILDAVKRGYTRVLNFALKHSVITVTVIFALFIASLGGVLLVGTQMFPETETGQINTTINMRKDISFEDATKVVDEYVDIVRQIEDVDTVGATMSAGSGGGGFASMMMGGGGGRRSNLRASVTVVLDPNSRKTAVQIKEEIESRTTGLDVASLSVSGATVSMDSLSGGGISIDVKGPDYETLEKVATDIADILRGLEGTANVSDGINKAQPELRISLNSAEGMKQGLTTAQVYMEAAKLFASDSAVSQMTLDNNEYKIFIDEQAQTAQTRADLEAITLSGKDGEIALGDIATIEAEQGYRTINRKGQERYLTVSAEIAKGYNIGIVSADLLAKLGDYTLPNGYTYEVGGQTETMINTFRDLLLMLLVGVIFIYLIMVAQFQSLKSPFIVMFTVPLAFTGGLVALFIMGLPISVVAFVGLIVLTGVVVNNGIVFVDYANMLVAEGMDVKEALIKTGNDRLRPILMTALTTIFALSTMTVGLNNRTELMQPMAITAIGGLVYATALTLVFIPVVYNLMNRRKKNK